MNNDPVVDVGQATEVVPESIFEVKIGVTLAGMCTKKRVEQLFASITFTLKVPEVKFVAFAPVCSKASFHW